MTNITRLGNPILRKTCRQLSREEIKSDEIQKIIRKLKKISATDGYSVGISANQIGADAAISVVAIKPTPLRPGRERFEKVLINPEIIEVSGRKVGVWEGCMSCGEGEEKVFGRVPRYKKVRVKYLDEFAKPQEAILTGLAAHVIQHETDHLNGIFFLDKASRKSLMMADVYHSQIVGTKQGNYYDRETKS